MSKIIKTVFIFCFCAELSYASTFLSRICEYDIENAIGLESNGNFIIKSEHISYYFGEDYSVIIVYHYIIKKMLPSENNTFGLSIRNRGHDGGLISDEKVNILNIMVNGVIVRVSYRDSPYEIIDDNFNPVNPDWAAEETFEEYGYQYMINGYLGWYYFNVDFLNSDEASIEIKYTTRMGNGIRYDSRPFWIPVSNDAEMKILIENKMNHQFLSYVTGCVPMNTLVTDTWRLVKMDPNTVEITYKPIWYFENKRVQLWFSNVYEAMASPNDHFFEIGFIDMDYSYRSTPGVYLTATSYEYYRNIWRRYNINISQEELGQFEFIFLNGWQLRIMRNAFYAVYRYRFNDQTLNEVLYYSRYGGEPIPDSWFNANFRETLLSPMERRNIEIIQNLENMRF
jgi:hypothetical protein